MCVSSFKPFSTLQKAFQNNITEVFDISTSAEIRKCIIYHQFLRRIYKNDIQKISHFPLPLMLKSAAWDFRDVIVKRVANLLMGGETRR